MSGLKLIALDPEDLTILASHLQDAVGTVGDMTFLPRERRFVAILNRFDWSTAVKAAGGPAMRRQAALRIERVDAAQVQGVDLRNKGQAISVLTALFEPTTEPAGRLVLVLAGGGAIRLGVECIEIQLEDLGPVWQAKAVPTHDDKT